MVQSRSKLFFAHFLDDLLFATFRQSPSEIIGAVSRDYKSGHRENGTGRRPILVRSREFPLHKLLARPLTPPPPPGRSLQPSQPPPPQQSPPPPQPSPPRCVSAMSGGIYGGDQVVKQEKFGHESAETSSALVHSDAQRSSVLSTARLFYSAKLMITTPLLSCQTYCCHDYFRNCF